MSAKAVTGNEGTAREAVLRAMQEAAECVSGKKGAPKGPQGTQGIVILPNDMSWSPPKEKKKNKKDEDDDDDEGSGTSSLAPRNLSYSSNRAKVPKGPAKRKKAACPPPDRDDEEEEGEIHEDEDDDDDDDSGSGHSYTGIEIAIDHVNLYDWLLKWTKEYGIPGITPIGVFSTLCLDGTMDEWLAGVEEAEVPNAWADVGWEGMPPGELVCVFTYITILLTLGDLAVETGTYSDTESERDVLVLSPNHDSSLRNKRVLAFRGGRLARVWR